MTRLAPRAIFRTVRKTVHMAEGKKLLKLSHRQAETPLRFVRPPRIPAVAAVAWVAILALAPASGASGYQDPDTPPDETVRVPGESLSVYLLTVEQGDLIYELFGHNALVVRDAETGYEAAFNYGIFDLRGAGFYAGFLKGRMMYAVRAESLPQMLDAYRTQNRRVWAQELDLEPSRKARLLELLQTAVLPANYIYPYQYYLNNCSTKLRDVLDAALDGQLRSATDGPPTGATWREHTRRLTAKHPLGYLGINLVLGPKGDELTNRWQEMWVPMKLRDTAGALFVTRSDGSRTRLVRSEELWASSSREHEPTTAPSLGFLFLLFGLAAGLFLSFFGYRAAAGSTVGRVGLGFFGCLWGAFCLVAGGLMIAVHWTDHEFMYWNQNILLLSPLGAGVAAGLVRVAKKGRTGIWGRRFALSSLGLAVVALVLSLIPSLASGNQEMIAFAIPVHLSVCWVMLGVHKMDHALVYG